MRIISLIILLVIGCYSYGQQHIMEIYDIAVSESSSAAEDIHYLFENNTDDESGNSYSFTNTNGTYETTPTPPEGSYLIDCGLTTAYFTLPSSYTDNFPDDFTIMFWVQSSISNTNILLVEAVSKTDGFAIRLNTAGNDLDIFTDGTEAEFNNFASAPTYGVMIHYAVDYTSSTGTLHVHINGVETSLDAGSVETDIDLTGAWKIATGSAGYHYMDDFRIFPEVLSSSEILSIKNNPGTPLDDI